jgi:hypothetical protein
VEYLEVGLSVQVKIQLTHSLKARGFNPLAYEVKRWIIAFAVQCNLYRYIEAVQAAADLVTVVPQEALTRDGAGEALTVKEATEFADTTLQWSLWTLLEMLRSPAWVGLHGRGCTSVCVVLLQSLFATRCSMETDELVLLNRRLKLNAVGH